MVGEAEKAPPSILYCVVKFVTDVTLGNVNAALQVLAGAVITGAVGKTVKLFVSEQLPEVVVYVAVKQPAVEGVNTPVPATIEPPPLTDQLPAPPPDCVKVTVPPPKQALVVVTVGTVHGLA